MAGTEVVASARRLSQSPTFAHSLAGFLTRNGQRGDWTEMEKEIEQFMGDSKLEVRRSAAIRSLTKCVCGAFIPTGPISVDVAGRTWKSW